MVKRLLLIALTAALPGTFVACKKSKKEEQAAVQAKFQAEQKKKAVSAYKEIVTKYPDSPYAEKAKERLKTLAPPTPGK